MLTVFRLAKFVLAVSHRSVAGQLSISDSRLSNILMDIVVIGILGTFRFISMVLLVFCCFAYCLG